MRNKPSTYLSLALLACLAGCQPPGIEPLIRGDDAATVQGDSRHLQSEVAVTIRWPYRAQVLPTSAQHLRFELSGPTSQTVNTFRPDGSSPTSTATMSVEVGTGYILTVQAYDNAATPRLVASGTSIPFNVRANERTDVTIALVPVFVPTITGFVPSNGGPGTAVQVYGTGFGKDRGLVPGFSFGGVFATNVYPPDEGTVSVLVPASAISGPLLPKLDGVVGTGSGSFTVLSALGIEPATATVASGSPVVFTARATTSEQVAFTGTPTVAWTVSGPLTSLPPNQYRIQINGDGTPETSTESVSVGTIDQAGRFMATATGSAEIAIQSGYLMATASITVTE